MPRPRKRRAVDLDEIEAILNGEIQADLARLLELVRRVNPSRLACVVEERERRYALKARLQSHVLRAFSSELTSVPTRRPGIIAIRRRGQRGDACHAVVARLDPDVRAAVAASLEPER